VCKCVLVCEVGVCMLVSDCLKSMEIGSCATVSLATLVVWDGSEFSFKPVTFSCMCFKEAVFVYTRLGTDHQFLSGTFRFP